MAVDRRSLLALAAGLPLAGATLACTTLTGAALTGTALGDAPKPAADGLHVKAAGRNRFFGAAIDREMLDSPAGIQAHVAAECGMVVGEYSFKWEATQPAPKVFDFAAADAVMAFAKRRGLPVRGHNLAWHESNPDWLAASLTPATAEGLLTSHIQTVAGHFKGRMAHWDVVNEPMEPADRAASGLRNSIWLQALGPRYIDVAFHACAAADPGALRVLNEFGTDYTIPWQAKKREALLALLADLVARRVPIQAVGLQAHLDAAELSLDQTVLARFIADIAALGLKVVVTELDVRDDRLPADPISRDIAVAAMARAWLDAVLPNPAVLGVLSWGLTDRRSWLNTKFPRPDGLAQRPLPLDEKMRRKPLWTAIGDAFTALPPPSKT